MANLSLSAPERVSIGDKTYLVCAECRRPMLSGHTTIYDVPVPEKGLPGAHDPAQSLCDVCYLAQHRRIYPRFEQPKPHGPEFQPLPVEPIPWSNMTAEQPLLVRSEQEVFDLAVKIVRRRASPTDSFFTEVKQAYERLIGMSREDLETTFDQFSGVEVTVETPV